jgi:hypothetical protein
MSTVKKFALLLLLVVAAPLFLSGCIEFTLHLTINRNLTSDLDITLTMPRALLALEPELEEKFLREKKEELARQGFEVADHTGDSMIGFRATKKLQSVEELAGLSLARDMGLEGRDIFTVEKKALTTTYYLDADVDLSDLIGEENNRIFALFPPDMRFLLTLPVRPLDHNATSITADERTLEWTLSLEGGNHIELAARVPNPSAVILGIVLILLLLGAIIAAIYLRKSSAGARTGKKAAAK